MRRVLKAVLLTVVGLLGLVVLVGAAWFLSNVRDAEPKPWPSELTVTPLSPGDDTLLTPFATVSSNNYGNGSFRLPDCSSGDCRSAYEKSLHDWHAWQEKAQAFVRTCESLPTEAELRLREPELAKPSDPLPPYAPLKWCHAHWVLKAEAARRQGAWPTALAALQRADGLARVTHSQSRLLIGQMISQSLIRQQLDLVREWARLEPIRATELLPFARWEAAGFSEGIPRWVAMEAQFGKGAIDELQAQQCEKQRELMGWWGRLTCRVTLRTLQPEYARQLMAQDWAALAQLSRQHPVEALPAHLPPLPQSSFSWSHTMPTLLWSVARPAHRHYVDRTADVALATQATALWLEAHAVTAADRVAWLKRRTSGELAARLTITPEGEWVLRPWRPEDAQGLPLRWPAIRS